MRSLRIFTFLLFIAVFSSFSKSFGQDVADSAAYQQRLMLAYLDSINNTIKYETGVIQLGDIASLNIPSGYKFIPKDKAAMVLHDIWGNPEGTDVLGMVVKSDYTLADINSWAFVVSYEEAGYVKDEDADDIDYDELLKSIQADEEEINKERVKQGYERIHVLGWAVKPFYDKKNKILHWAKKIQFGEPSADPTLNYDVRILGRKGILSLNAVGVMSQLPEINKHISNVLTIANFKDGSKYTDFDPSVDKVAAYTIGGLIAGKLIAKTGLWILLLKNIKLILLGFLAAFGTFRKKIAGLFNRKKDTDEPANVAPVDILAPATAVAEETDNLLAEDSNQKDRVG